MANNRHELRPRLIRLPPPAKFRRDELHNGSLPDSQNNFLKSASVGSV